MDDGSYIESIQNQEAITDVYDNVIPKKTKRHNERRNRVSIMEHKALDNGYCCIQTDRKTPTGSHIYIEYYYTNLTPGALIRNATTGGYEYGYKVGSSDEDLLFKVTRAVGDFKNKDSHMLFYNSPEQYERHFMTVLPVETKEKWTLKNIRARTKISQ